MFCLKLVSFLLETLDLLGSPFKVYFEILAVDDTCLLLETLVDFLKLLPGFFEVRLLIFLVVELLIELLELFGLTPILLLDILELFTSMG